MLNNTITIGDNTYERYQEFADRSVYTADDHTVANPHTLTFGRVLPPASQQEATAKSRRKLSRTVRSADGKIGTIIIEQNVSFPQWVSADVVAAEYDDFTALSSDVVTRKAALTAQI